MDYTKGNFHYTERTHCIFCHCPLETTFFSTDLKCPVSHFSVPLETDDTTYIQIPYNVFECPQCFTLQNKYLGDTKEIYRINHADSTGKTMMELHKTSLSVLLNHGEDIKTGIIEIGSSLGILADLILEKMPKTPYSIIEPCFKGNRQNKRVLDDFFENVDIQNIKENVLIISHVFEHFYNPMEILTKIRDCPTIDTFLLVFPDLEYYLNNNVFHVLNTEHTFYVDNRFLAKTIENTLNFKLVETVDYENHSVIFYFKKTGEKLQDLETCRNVKHEGVYSYFEEIYKRVNMYNEFIDFNKTIVGSGQNINPYPIYLFPASIHSLFLTTFGLSNDFTGYVDNSVNKIGQKMYGTGKPIFNFMEIVKGNQPNTILFLNGGIFNEEIKNSLKESDNILTL
jgi:hypothetical protein